MVKKREVKSMEPVKDTAFTYILRCSCGHEMKRDLIPGQPEHNRRARNNFLSFRAQHTDRHYHEVKFVKEGIVPL